MPRWFAAALAAGVLLALAPGGAGAGAQESRQLVVDAGYQGLYTPGRPIPVRVSIRSERLIRGDLVVSTSESPVEVVLPVEVPGGSVKVFVLTLPTQVHGNVLNAVARLGDERADGRANARFDEELVGVLPSAHRGAALPGSTTLAVDAGTARFVALTDAELAAAPASFGPLTVMVAGRGEIGALDDATRAAVLSWIGGGGHLLAAADAGETIAGLPPAWQPGTDGRAAAGLGEVVAAGDEIEAGRWEQLVEPTPLSATARPVNVPPEEVQQSLAREAGVKVPELDWLLVYLGAYVVICVPLTLIVLRRRGRGELAWIVVPGLAIAFTVVAAVVGRDLREVGTAAHATTLRVGPTGAEANSVVGLVSTGNDVSVRWPARWSVGQPNFMFGPPAELRVEPSGTALEAISSSTVGQFNIQSARGLADVGGGLAVTAAVAEDRRAEGTVTSDLPFDLEDAAVFLDGGGARIGTIAAGAEVAFEVRGNPAADPFHDEGQRMWPGARPFGPGQGLPDLAMWATAVQDLAGSAFASGTVVVAGWTGDFRPPVGVGDRELTGSTLVVATAPVRQTENRSMATAVRTEKVRSPVRPGGGFDPNGATLVLRFVLPDPDAGAVSVGPLVVRAPERGVQLEVWRDDGWEHFGGDAPLDRPAAGPGGPPPPPAGMAGPMGPQVDFPLPDGAIRNGVVWVRATMGQAQANFDPFMLTMANFARLEEAV